MATNNTVNSPLSGTTGSGNFVGGTSPTFTTSWKYAASGFAINDNNNNSQITFTTTASAVNFFNFQNTATGFGPIISATGSDTNVNMNFQTKGTGSYLFSMGSSSILTLAGVSSAVNNFSMTASTTGNGPAFLAAGSDTNVNMNIETKGTGSFVFLSNATVSPANLLTLTPSSTPVNYVTLSSANTTVAPSIAASGSDTNILLQLSGKGNSGVGVQGTSTNSAAVAGNVGEIVSSSIVAASAATMTANTASNVTSISLTAGDWDVWGNITFVTLGTTVTAISGWVSTNSATTPDVSLLSRVTGTTTNILANSGMAVPSQRVLLSGTTTVYLSGLLTNTSGNGTACGNIFARRRR